MIDRESRILPWVLTHHPPTACLPRGGNLMGQKQKPRCSQIGLPPLAQTSAWHCRLTCPLSRQCLCLTASKWLHRSGVTGLRKRGSLVSPNCTGEAWHLAETLIPPQPQQTCGLSRLSRICPGRLFADRAGMASSTENRSCPRDSGLGARLPMVPGPAGALALPSPVHAASSQHSLLWPFTCVTCFLHFDSAWQQSLGGEHRSGWEPGFGGPLPDLMESLWPALTTSGSPCPSCVIRGGKG